jgi:hypothetical protein
MSLTCGGCMAYKNFQPTCGVVSFSKCPCRECIVKVVCIKICREFSNVFHRQGYDPYADDLN